MAGIRNPFRLGETTMWARTTLALGTMIALLQGATPQATGRASIAPRMFEQVPGNTWMLRSVSELNSAGMLIGYPKDYFSRSTSVTRYEIAVAIDRMLRGGRRRAAKPLDYEPQLPAFDGPPQFRDYLSELLPNRALGLYQSKAPADLLWDKVFAQGGVPCTAPFLLFSPYSDAPLGVTIRKRVARLDVSEYVCRLTRLCCEFTEELDALGQPVQMVRARLAKMAKD